jgi:FecR protein
MKTIILVASCTRPWIGCCAALTGLALTNVASGAQLAEAKVTAVVHDVKLLRGQAVLRPAAVNDEIRQDTAVRTGLESRSELTFPDLTIARLGANTIFSFNEEAREVKLINGAILLRVPKNSGGAKITTDAVTAGIVGTTVMMEFHPHGIAKFIVLEGVARLYLRNRLGESILVHAGEMMIVRSGATHLDDPVYVDISQIMKTSLLIIGFGPLPSDPLIASAESKQMQMKSEGQLIETNAVIYGSGTLITLTDEIDLRFAALPAATKFGKPETITTPNPFPITSATQINTDPTVTTGKVTASGKIYRGRAEDGPLSKYLFDSTSSFDKALKFDTELFADPNNLPVAFFKFQNLTLLGSLTITIGQNGVTKLGLVGVDGITSGPPGGNLTFDGLDLLVLATKASSIDLTSDLSFQNLKTLLIYARGLGSNLTLASPISGVTQLIFEAENAVRITTNLNVFSSLAVNAGGDLGSNGTLALAVQNSGRTIDTDGNTSLTAGGNISSQGLALLIANDNGGHIGAGAAINVTAANISTAAGGLDTEINDRQAGSIGSSAKVSFNVAGNITTQGDATLGVSTADLRGGVSGTIGGDAAIDVSAANITASSLSTQINNSNGGSIGGNATINFAVSGKATITNDATFRIDGSNGAASAAINISGGSYNAGGTFLGSIDGSGIITLNNVTIAADVVKVGVFGNNGTLRIGGGSISANTLMQLYAPGSNGIIDFVSNVTLRTSNAIPTIIANTVTIENGVVVTINAQADGARPADVFTNNANYSGSDGNGTTTGTFAGNGATTQPLSRAPLFATKRSNSNAVISISAVAPPLKAGSAPGPVPAKRPTIRVVDTPQLQSLLDNAARGIDGEVRISPVTRRNAPVQTSAGAILPRKDVPRSAAKMPSGLLVLKSP